MTAHFHTQVEPCPSTASPTWQTPALRYDPAPKTLSRETFLDPSLHFCSSSSQTHSSFSPNYTSHMCKDC